MWADHDRLEQVFVNLLENAFRHNPPGLHVERRGVGSREPTAVAIRVCDDGGGIPPELRPHLFESAGAGATTAAGAGLGLSIVAGIVSAHGGEITLARTSERGACFLIVLPVGGPGERASGDRHRAAHQGAARRRRPEHRRPDPQQPHRAGL